MKSILLVILAAGVVGLSFIPARKNLKPETASISINGSYSPVAVLELFTSEGCSSCPPADRLLPVLAKLDPHVIPLSFHVDYWNRLGWVDPFSRSEFSDRQSEYNNQLGTGGSYTPQLIVNGEYELVGSSRSKAEAAIKKALLQKSSVQLSLQGVKMTGNTVSFKSQASGDFNNTELQAVVLQKMAVNNIKAGENSGARLTHINVVRVLEKQTTASENEFQLQLPQGLSLAECQLVVYTRQKSNLKVNGAVVFTPE